MNMKKLRA